MVDSLEFKQVLKDRGFNGLIIQYGNGKYVPSTLNKDNNEGFQVTSFDLKPSIAEDFDKSYLIIGHAGLK